MVGVHASILDWEDEGCIRDGIPKTTRVQQGATIPVRDFCYVREKQNYFLLKLGNSFSFSQDLKYLDFNVDIKEIERESYYNKRVCRTYVLYFLLNKPQLTFR